MGPTIIMCVSAGESGIIQSFAESTVLVSVVVVVVAIVVVIVVVEVVLLHLAEDA